MFLKSKPYLLIITFVFFNFFLLFDLIGQTNSNKKKEHQKFNDVFEKEMTKASEFNSQETLSPYHFSPYKLPYWFSSVPVTQNDTSFSIGISDPYLPQTGRLSQAINRAIGMSSLLRNTEIKMMRDIYNADYLRQSKSDYLSKFEELYQLSSSVIEYLSWDTVHIDTTKFGEVVVLLKVFPNRNADDIDNSINSFKIDYFNVEYQRSGKYELINNVDIFHIAMDSKSIEVEPLYSYTKVNKIVDIRSKYDNSEVLIEADYYKYSSTETLPDNIEGYSKGNLHYGLWYGYVSTALQSLLKNITPKDVSLQTVDEYFTESFHDFSREKYIKDASFEFGGIYISNNQIFINLTTK